MRDLRRQRTAAGGGAVLVLRFAATAVLNYGFGVALAWLLPRSEFGAVSVLQNVVLLAGAVVAAGLPWALARVVAHAEGRADGAEGAVAGDLTGPAGNDVDAPARAGAARAVGPAFRAALAGNLGLGVVLVAGFVAVQLTPLRVIPDGSLTLTVAVALTIVLLSLNAVFAGALQGSRRFDALGLLQTSETAVKVAVGLAAVALLGLGVGGVALGFAVGAVVATACGWWGLRDRLPGRGPLAGRTVFAAAVPMEIGTTSFALLGTVDVLALSALGRGFGVGTGVLAFYQAAAILARAPYFVADSIGDAVFPFMARGKTWAEANHWFLAAYRCVLLGLVPVQLVLIIAPEPVLGVLFPAGYGAAAGLVRLLSIGSFGLLSAVLLMKALYARGLPGAVARRTPVAVVVELAALIVLVPRYGATGAALAFTAGTWTCGLLLSTAYLAKHRAAPVVPPSQRRSRSNGPWDRSHIGHSSLIDGERRGHVRGVGAYLGSLGVLTGALVVARGVSGAGAAMGVIVAGVLGYALVGVRLGLLRAGEIGWVRGRLGALSTRVGPVLPLVGCGALAGVTVLWNVASSPDTQYDEVVYTRAAQEVAQGWHLTWTNRPMFVHPPLSFLAQAGWLRAVGRSAAPLADAIVAARLLTGVATVAAVVLLALLASRLTPWAGARRRALLVTVIGVLAATDPILLRYGRLAIIEPLALLGCLLTLYLAVALRDRSALLWVAVVGTCTGLTLLTKEVSIFMLLTPALYALLGRDWRGAGRAMAALATGLAWWLLFPLWAVRLGLVGSFVDVKFATAERLVGLLQITGWNRPGASFVSAVEAAFTQYTSSYLALAGGALALGWLLLHRLTDSARWLLAWLLTSYGFGAYTVLLGTLNEQFFVFVLPAALVGTVLVVDAVVADAVAARAGVVGGTAARGTAARGTLARGTVARGTVVGDTGLRDSGARVVRRRRRWPVVVAPVLALLAVLASAGVSWVRFYPTAGDGVIRATGFIRQHLPACSAVNATGDVEKYAYLLPGHAVTFHATGPGALSQGVHLFFLSDKDAVQRYGNATPELNSWVRAHGTRMASFRSPTYRGVELWRVPADRRDPLADMEGVRGGYFVETEGSRCGGYPVVDGPVGNVATAWSALGGKAVVGPPVTASWTVRGVGRQVFDGAVLTTATAGDRAVTAAPVVPALAAAAPAAYRNAGLPPVTAPATSEAGARRLSDAEVRARLTDPAIAAAYLGVPAPGGRRLLGDPVGPATAMPDGWVRQAFAGGVLERPPAAGQTRPMAASDPRPAATRDTRPVPAGDVRLAPIGALAVAAGVVDPPATARRPTAAPPLLNDPSSPQPTTVEPFVTSFGAVLAGSVVATGLAVLLRRRRRPRPEPATVEEVAA